MQWLGGGWAGLVPIELGSAVVLGLTMYFGGGADRAKGTSYSSSLIAIESMCGYGSRLCRFCDPLVLPF